MSRKTLQKNLSYDERRNLFYVASQIDGRRHSRTYHTYDDALAALYPGVSRDSGAKGRPIPEPTATLGQWLDWWLTEDVAPSRAVSTTYGYRNIVHRHLLPMLGDVPLTELSSLLLQTYLSVKLGEGLSPNTVLKHYTLLHAALGQAVKLGLIPVDPSRKITPPRRDPSRYTCYSPQQLRILFQATEGTTLGLAVRLAAYLGLRRSEITGLRWRCVDLKAKVVLIQEVRTEVGGQEVLKEPKTRRSLRRLGISGCTELLAELERAWAARKSDDPSEFVLLRVDGTTPSPDLLTRQMARLTEKITFPKSLSMVCGTPLPPSPTASTFPCTTFHISWATAPFPSPAPFTPICSTRRKAALFGRWQKPSGANCYPQKPLSIGAQGLQKSAGVYISPVKKGCTFGKFKRRKTPMKKFLSLVLALVMTMSLVTISAGAKDYTDASKIQYNEAIDVVSTIGIVDGYADGSFNPSATLTRGAAAKIICNLLLGPTTASALAADAAPYSDVPANSTFAGYIAYCQKEGIISGYADGTFRPGNTLTGYAFMKMLLGALGYDASVEGYTGANWSINVAKQALNIGLDTGLVDDFNGTKAVTREEACLYAFNMLQSDLVEYPNKTTIEIGDTTVNLGTGTAKAVQWTTSAAADGNIDEQANGDGYIQFAEQYFNKLVRRTSGDGFGRPATTWTYKGVETGTYAEVADVTYYKDVKLNAIYADLDMVDTAADTYLYVNGLGGKITGVQNVSRSNDTKLSKVNARSAVVGDGTIVEAFLNTNTNVVTICAMSVYGGKITDVKEATSKRDAYVVVTPGTKDAANLAVNDDTFETEDFAEDDVVAFTYSQNPNWDCIMDMYKMESVEGTLTKRVVGKSVQIGEETIPYAKEYDFDTINEGSLSNKSSYVVYKDSQGNALWIEESKFGVDAYAYVDNITNSGDGMDANRARLVLADGTKKTVDLDKDYVTGSIVSQYDLVRFSENKDGTYKLVKITGTASGKDKASFTISAAKATNLGAAVDAETIFVINKSGETSYKVYTGIKNAPQVTASTEAEAYVRNGVAKIVFVRGATVLNTSKEVTFVATKSVSKVNTSTDDSVDYYVYNAVVNGEITTIAVKSTITMNGGDVQTVVAGADETTGTKYQGLIFNAVTFDSTDDAVIDSTSFTGPASVYYATGVKKATDSTIKLAGSLKDVSAKCAVYEVDDGGDIEAIDFEDIKTNSAADVVYTMEDGEITNLFIILPKD